MPIAKSITDRTLSSPQGERAYEVAERLLDAGREAWWVGGCVRDMLLGRVPEEIDIATDAKPAEVAARFPKCDESAAALGVVLVSHRGHVFEVTTFREEHELSDGRFPQSVRFTTRAKDAERRDITVNALYWNPLSSELYDPFRGERDLHERLIRVIGDPETRIRHDALRLLRVVRFRALIAGQYHPDTFAALHRRARDIAVLSGTRRMREIEKALLGPDPARFFEDLWETDVIEHLLPELHACKGVAQPSVPHGEGDVWDHIMRVIGSCTDDHGADVRWAALLHDIGKPATFSIEDDRIHFNEHAKAGEEMANAALDRLQFPARRRDKIGWIVGHHMMMGVFGEMNDERKAHWYYHPWFLELLQLFWLDIAGTQPSDFSLYEAIIRDYNAFLDARPKPPKALLRGDDVMEILGLTPGEEVGKALRALHDAQARGDVRTKAEARAFLQRRP